MGATSCEEDAEVTGIARVHWNAHAQHFYDLLFSVGQFYSVCNIKGSGEIARLRSLARAFVERIRNKHFWILRRNTTLQNYSSDQKYVNDSLGKRIN